MRQRQRPGPGRVVIRLEHGAARTPHLVRVERPANDQVPVAFELGALRAVIAVGQAVRSCSPWAMPAPLIMPMTVVGSQGKLVCSMSKAGIRVG